MRPGIALALAPKTLIHSAAEVESWVPAFNEGLAEFCDAYSRRAVEITFYGSLASIPVGMPAVLGMDHGEDPDALAYHMNSRRGVSGVGDFGACQKYGASPTSALDHEFKETIADAFTNGWVETPTGLLLAREVCDPVQENSYKVNGVALSDYVLPSWFDPFGEAPFSFCRAAPAPFEVAKGGYMVTRNATGEKTVYGRKAPWRGTSPIARGAQREGYAIPDDDTDAP